MFNIFICSVCHQDLSGKIYSYFLKTQGCMITKAVCECCKEDTHEKWIENEWTLADEN